MRSKFSRSFPLPPNCPVSQRELLRQTARDTLDVLPNLLQQLGKQAVACHALKYTADLLPRLHPDRCPAFPSPTTIRVVNDETLNVAADMVRSQPPHTDIPPPLVVNFANRHRPGGGWLNGSMAQEEALCYRSSLALSLRKDLYPLEPGEVLYSPYVLIVRDDLASGHNLLAPATPPADLPVVSALTVAALCRPEVRTMVTSGRFRLGVREQERRRSQESRERERADLAPLWRQQDERLFCDGKTDEGSTSVIQDVYTAPDRSDEDTPMDNTARLSGLSICSMARERPAQTIPNGAASFDKRPLPEMGPPPLADWEMSVFARDGDRDFTKSKMRLTLRTAAASGHDRLVLGALGCGVYGNPAEDVAHCWLEVLREYEFQGAGHWWRDVVFAVYANGANQSSRDGRNYGIFHRVLDGQQV